MSITNATKAFTVKLDGHTFKPEFTYQIFQDESVFGYSRPRITLEFDQNYMPLISFRYAEKVDVGATDVVATLKEQVELAFTDRDEWEAADTKIELELGEPMATFDDYKVHKVGLQEANKVMDRIRVLVKLFIDGGSYIDRRDSAWEVYLLYKGDRLAGFCTVYPYFYYADGATFQKEGKLLRKRVSQFLVFPPYQRQAVGTRFLKALYADFAQDNRVREVTVEDPSESFDTIRERVSLELYGDVLGKLKLPLDEDQIATAAKDCKTDTKIVCQLFEMHYLQQHGATKDFRRLLKTRLYQQSYLEFESETLQDKKEKLDTVYENVLSSYRQILKLPEPETTEEAKESEPKSLEDCMPPRKRQHLE